MMMNHQSTLFVFAFYLAVPIPAFAASSLYETLISTIAIVICIGILHGIVLVIKRVFGKGPKDGEE
jgi:hypothetical protein